MKLFRNIIFVSLFACLAGAEESNVVPQVDELTAAYQREILFLSTYKEELIAKKESVEKVLGQKVQMAKSELDGLEKKWLKIQTNNELLMQKLADLERDLENKKENKELLATIMQQAQLSLNEQTKNESNKEEQALITKVSLLLNQALKSLQSADQVTIAQGTFYLKNGEESSGDIIQLGQVARFAQKDGRVAALYPSGGGSFRVWKWLDGGAQALMQNQIPQNLKFFLFDNPNKEFVAQREKTTWDVLLAGGLIGWVIVVMGLCALVISGLRFMLLQKAHSKNPALLEQVIQKIVENKLEEAQHLLLSESNSISRVLAKTLSYLRTEPKKVEDAINEAILKESQIIDRFGVVILVIASVAPLMGLLGTVTGMISTFDIITLYGTGNPKLLSGGISEALITTMFGLIVAIPALLIGQFLNSRNEGIKSDMEKWALATCNAFQNREASE